MIQEKDFLYRVPVKTAPITTPGGQIRNPEILVDVEGGEFMYGNILDANSTNKLINQSVKDAVDNKLIESGYVTKDLLEAETTRATEQENSLKTLIGAETSARTKGDEDLNSKIKAEQTRAEGKEKEISDKLAIVNGDSNTEGSFRKAIADVVAAAPEDLDTLKEIADKLAGNDDLHTALNQAITEKADTSALLNEVTRATGVENNLKATLVNYALNSDVEEKLAQKADTTMLSEFIDKTSTEEQAINSPLHAKEYISVFHNTADGASGIKITPLGFFSNQNDSAFTVCNANDFIHIKSLVDQIVRVQPTSLYCSDGTSSIDINSTGISLTDDDNNIRLNRSGVTLPDGNSNYVLTSAGSTINIAEYATKSNLSSQLNPKADRSDLMALEQKVTANTTAIEGKQDKGNYVTYSSKDDEGYHFDRPFILNGGQLTVSEDGSKTKITCEGISINDQLIVDGSGATFKVDDEEYIIYGVDGIVNNKYQDCVPITDGTLKPLSDFALTTDLHNVIIANNVVDGFYELDNALKIGSEAEGFLTMRNSTISSSVNGRGFVLNWHGLTFEGRRENNEVPTTDGSFISLNNYVLKSEYNKKITALEARIAALEAKHQEAA